MNASTMKDKTERRLTMGSSLPINLFVLLILCVLPLGYSKQVNINPVLKYKGGPILRGNVNLSLLWYGRFGRVQKSTIGTFIRSLNTDGGSSFEPRVSSWWRIIESYQSAAKSSHRKTSPRIRVQIVKQMTDNSYSAGKVLTQDSIPGLVQKVSAGSSSTVTVIFTSKQVRVKGLCMGKCSQHGVMRKGSSPQLYIIVGDPEAECPGQCAWPFSRANEGPQSLPLQPPSGNVGADAMVISFASALAGTMTNPYNNGFYQGPATSPLEAATACRGIFGSGAFPGYAGKVRVDPSNGGCFNAHGVHDKKFLLPALWNPKTSSCWTTM